MRSLMTIGCEIKKPSYIENLKQQPQQRAQEKAREQQQEQRSWPLETCFRVQT